MDPKLVARLQAILDALVLRPSEEDRESLFSEAIEILDSVDLAVAPEAEDWYSRFAEVYSDDGEEPAFDEEPEVAGKEEEDPKDPEEEPEIPQPKLPGHQIDVPEEPETVNVKTLVFDPQTQQYVERDLGNLLLIPTGCEEPEHLSPYENSVFFRSPLPRDKERDANLYALYQDKGWASRRWIRMQLDEDIDDHEVDKEIADDIPVTLALQGKPDVSTGAAQTPGVDGKGDNNGAPLPPGPGPGRGNKFAPGDNGATQGMPDGGNG